MLRWPGAVVDITLDVVRGEQLLFVERVPQHERNEHANRLASAVTMVGLNSVAHSGMKPTIRRRVPSNGETWLPDACPIVGSFAATFDGRTHIKR